MKSNNEDKIEFINLVPFIGIVIFIGLYIYASTLYPGGSQANLNSEGFDWINNYWCNLMNEKGMNGQVNPARPISITALILLCLSLMMFFIQFARTYPDRIFWRRVIGIGGSLSMLFALFIFTEYHDLMTIISSFFGLFAVIGITREIYKSTLTIYKVIGLFGLILLALNNYIYYTEQFIEWLPLLQKITFTIVLFWLLGLNFQLIKKRNASNDMK